MAVRQLTRLASLALLVAILLVVSGCAAAVPADTGASSAESETEGEVVKIGFMAASTGGAAFLGGPERDAAMMIKEQMEGQQFTAPDGTPRTVEIVEYDTEGSADVAIPLAKKLIDNDQVSIIVGGTRSPVSLALVPIMQEAEIPFISMASSSEIVEPIAERYWIFKTPQSNRHTAPWQVRYVKEQGINKIASLYVNNAYGEDGRNAIEQAAEELGVEIVLEETFEASDTDMTAQLTKINASEAEALLVTGLPPAASILTKQFRELGMDMPLVHNHGIGMKPFIDLAGPENAEGVVFPIGKLVAVDALEDGDPQKAVLQQFISEYEEYTGEPASTFAGHAWDGVHMALNAIESMPAGLSLEEQRAFLRDAVENMEFVGTGGVFNLSPEDHVGLSPDDVVTVRITDGEWEYFPPENWGAQ
jgi:branched-chain amino acid transport system substrate-binding protein